MKRIKALSFILALILALGLLTACNSPVERAIKTADRILAGDRYAVDMSFSFESDSAELLSILTLLSDVETRMTVDGDNVAVKSSASVTFLGQVISVDSEYIAIGNELYAIESASGMGFEERSASRATMSNEERREFSSDASGAVDFDFSDFRNMSFETNDDGLVITYTDANGSLCDEMTDVIDSSLETMGARVDVESVTLSVAIKDGKYNKITMVCRYDITVDGESVSLDMTIVMDYDYDDIQGVVAPADGDSYEKVTYEDIMEN